jgi:X-Pro dipeptidyl-peptidase
LPATAVQAIDPPTIVVTDGLTQPVFSYADAVRETLWVEAPMDSDFDGRRDLIRMDVIRPIETEAGLKVPSIMEASPYYNPGTNITTPRGFPGWWDEYFVPRGYAIVQVEMQGTSRSEGCPAIGGSEDTISIKAAVDWLNGRAPGFQLDGTPATAYWSTGAVGMQGVSYVGTLPNAVAVEGVPGLKTVVPIAAISNYYFYSRDQGIRRTSWGTRYPEFLANFVMQFSPRARAMCAAVADSLGDNAADDTGDFTPFWRVRNYIPAANKIKTSSTAVFMVHGYGDTNVKPMQTSELWYEVARRNMPRKIWIHRGGHSNPTSFRNTEWQRVMHLWMDRWLHGIPNGIMSEPMADIQRPDGTWVTDTSWPSPGTTYVDLRLGPATSEVPGTLSVNQSPDAPTQSFVDTWTTNRETTITANAQLAHPNRLVYLTPPLATDVRISGTPKASVQFSIDAPSTTVSALLVDYGEAPTVTVSDKTPLELVTEPCSPEDFVNLTNCAEPDEVAAVITPERTITRGHIDGKNNVDLRWGAPLVPGEPYNIKWDMQPHDYVVPAGHRIGLVIVGNYRATSGENNVIRDTLAEGHTITVQLNNSRLSLPIVGGKVALQQ